MVSVDLKNHARRKSLYKEIHSSMSRLGIPGADNPLSLGQKKHETDSGSGQMICLRDDLELCHKGDTESVRASLRLSWPNDLLQC